MTPITDQQVAEQEAAAVAMRATRAVPATTPARHSERTDQCPAPAKFALVQKFGHKWSPEEWEHVRGCAFCQKVYAKFAAAMAALIQEETMPDDAQGLLDTGTDDTVRETKPAKKSD